jgi:aromatic ring hydroxylase
MLMTGSEYRESIRDGRRVYIGSERVDDVTTHPAFRNAAQTLATIYDRKRAPENREVMTCEEDGETFSAYFLLPRMREDLYRRFETHRRIASWTHGLIGRSPDNFPSYVSGLVMDPAMFERIRQGFGANIQRYYRPGGAMMMCSTPTAPQRPDSVAGVRGLELGNVALIACRPNPLVRQNIFVPETFRVSPVTRQRGGALTS